MFRPFQKNTKQTTCSNHTSHFHLEDHLSKWARTSKTNTKIVFKTRLNIHVVIFWHLRQLLHFVCFVMFVICLHVWRLGKFRFRFVGRALYGGSRVRRVPLHRRPTLHAITHPPPLSLSDQRDMFASLWHVESKHASLNDGPNNFLRILICHRSWTLWFF